MSFFFLSLSLSFCRVTTCAGEATSRLHCPHKDVDDVTRQLMQQLNRQLAERQNADTQQSMYLDLSVSTSDGVETMSLIFPDAERRVQWEDAFTEVKQKMGTRGVHAPKKMQSCNTSRVIVIVIVIVIDLHIPMYLFFFPRYSVRAEDKKAPPDFLNLIPIRKTRSGLQFTCAAPTLGLNAHKLKDVWVCNSDGYVGQVKQK